LARAISDAGWAEFARQAAVQASPGVGGEILIADRWYPSSQQTSAGGAPWGREDSAVVTCCAHLWRGGIMMVFVVVVPGKDLGALSL